MQIDVLVVISSEQESVLLNHGCEQVAETWVV